MKQAACVVAIGLGLLLTTGCASEFRVPVTGRIGGQPAFGHSTARLQGESTFTVDTASGLRCEGVYDAMTSAPELAAEGSCNDGRTAKLSIVRNTGRLGGVARGTLSDGTKGQFVFGRDMRYEDAFPGPDETAPPIPQVKPRRR